MRIFLFCGLFLFYSYSWASLNFTTSTGDEITITVHPTIDNSQGDSLLIWLPSEAGPQDSEKSTSQKLSQHNIEVWQVNLLEDLFLPIVTSSMDRLPESTVSELIQFAINKTGKKIYLVTSGRGAIPFLRGARQWQLQHPASTGLAGAILISSKFYVETPDPGIEAQLMPIVSSTNLPLFVIQPDKSPWFWKLSETIPALQKSGSDVYVRYLDNVRDRFFFRPDATDYEKQLTSQLPIMLVQALKLLAPYSDKTRNAVKTTQQKPKIKIGKKDRVLQPYKGNPVPPLLRLQNLENKKINLVDLKGKVVLVNFWATWCPPCVHEMPSMQRLQNKFRDQPFTILGVNMAEDVKTVQKFLKEKVSVNFPVIMDYDGTALKTWGVFAFPTSYVIDKQGRIRYALFGGIEWDTPGIVQKISGLVKE